MKRDLIEEVPAGTCCYCPAAAERDTHPPLCLEHLDMFLLLEAMRRRSVPVTVEAAQATLAQAQKRGGLWTITEADLPRMLPEFLAQVQTVQVQTVSAALAGLEKETGVLAHKNAGSQPHTGGSSCTNPLYHR